MEAPYADRLVLGSIPGTVLHPPLHRDSRNEKAQSKLGFVINLRGAGEMNRTPDLLITNELLYRLSYTGLVASDYSGGW